MKKIVIVDFGGQYAHLIARRVREHGIYSEIQSPRHINVTHDVAGIIFSGGPRSVTEEDLLAANLNLDNLQIPLLGICYGHQLIAALSGGTVSSSDTREYGKVRARVQPRTPLFAGLPDDQQVWMSHGDTVTCLPDDFIVTASTPTTEIAGYMHTTKPIFGIQFHPEVTHSEYGRQILANFLNLCTSEKSWDMSSFETRILDEIREQAAGKKLLLLISGGVDSLVALALCIKATGNESVHALHVDTGFMRYQESDAVMEFLHHLGFKNLTLVRAGDMFFEALQHVTEPEQKRKIIGGLFVKVMHEALNNFNLAGDDWALVQGTIYPDTIESGGTEQASTIKTHHNRVAEIEDLMRQGKVIEPLRELYKDEVRRLGHSLGLPEELVERRPFPGPGLAIRLLASGANEDNMIANESALAETIAEQAGFNARILPVKSVGVQGDFRTYRHPAIVWLKETQTANWSQLHALSTELVNTLHEVNRVVFSLRPFHDELTLRETYITPELVHRLQLADHIVQQYTAAIQEIWQMPVVLLPLFDEQGKQAVVLRPICSQDAMTADVYEMDFSLLSKLITRLQAIEGIGQVFYDITTKPPGTIEWE